VYRLTEGAPAFQPACAPTAEQLHALLAKIIRWIVFLPFHLQEYRGPAPR
jgi:hypothetical protein